MTNSKKSYIDRTVDKIIKCLETEDVRYYGGKDFEDYIRLTLEDDCLEPEECYQMQVILNGYKYDIVDKLADWFIDKHIDLLFSKRYQARYKEWIAKQDVDNPRDFLDFSLEFIYAWD